MLRQSVVKRGFVLTFGWLTLASTAAASPTLIVESTDDAPASHAASEPSDDVKELALRYFRAGLSLQKTEDFEAAIAAYQMSLELYPNKNTLFNLANCQRAQHRYADAWSSLKRLQAEFGTELVEPMSSTARAQLEELENLTAVLAIETQPTGASVEVDDQTLGTTPLAAPIRLKIGKHTVRVSLLGYQTATVVVDLTPRQSTTRTFVLSPVPAAQGDVAQLQTTQPGTAQADTAQPGVTQAAPEAAPTSTTSPLLATSPASHRDPTWTTVGLASMAAGAVGVAIGATLGLRAVSVNDELTAACDAGRCSASRAPQIERLERLVTAANVWCGVGAGLLLTGATIVLWPSNQEAASPMSLNVHPTGLSLTGAF